MPTLSRRPNTVTENNSQTVPVIRMLSPADVPAFRAIRLESLQRDPAAFASTTQDWLKISNADWQRHLTDNAIFAAFEGETPVAIMGLMRQRASKMAHRATLIMVYVRKIWRGTGLTQTLLDMVDRHAAVLGIRQLELAVRADNAGAVGFYEKAGFATIGRVPGGFLQDGQEFDEILMARRTGRLETDAGANR